MPTIDQPITAEIRASLPGAASEGAALVGVSEADDPARIVEAINAFVASPPKSSFFKRVDNWNDRAMPLGALWGNQLVRKFGWEWILVDEAGEVSIGVFDPNRSMGVYPFDFVFHSLESGEYPTILLAFNMLVEGQIHSLPSRGYENVMDGVAHIVPPR